MTVYVRNCQSLSNCLCYSNYKYIYIYTPCNKLGNLSLCFHVPDFIRFYNYNTLKIALWSPFIGWWFTNFIFKQPNCSQVIMTQNDLKELFGFKVGIFLLSVHISLKKIKEQFPRTCILLPVLQEKSTFLLCIAQTHLTGNKPFLFFVSLCMSLRNLVPPSFPDTILVRATKSYFKCFCPFSTFSQQHSFIQVWMKKKNEW